MKVATINTAGNWSPFWTESLKKAALLGTNCHEIGQKLLLENKRIKVWNIQLKAGSSLPFHKHDKPYFYVCHTKGISRSYYSNGSIIETQYEPNDIKYFKDLNAENFFIHNLENIGNTTLHFTTVEFT
ncbi:hypothetical protein [Tenacibaculum sp. SDUM215027]|uniref:hypothetical protein n=1 Tax=Tenacibaculum sp. SDUM215027 TaxID=3422596 RepID=UPI003D31EEAD